MQTKYFGKDNSLCPSCDDYGTNILGKLQLCVDLVYGERNPKRNKSKSVVDEFEVYLVRGGNFYACLERRSKCIHWCTVFALSDPLDTY